MNLLELVGAGFAAASVEWNVKGRPVRRKTLVRGPRVPRLAFTQASCIVSLPLVCVRGEPRDCRGRHVPQGLPAGLPERTAHPGPVHHLLFSRPGDVDRGK